MTILEMLGDTFDKGLGLVFNGVSATSRFLVLLYSIGTLTFVAWSYERWRTEPLVRVDIIFPCLFPLATATLHNGYEFVSLVFFTRKWAINPLVVFFDVAVAAVGVFCTVVINMSGHTAYQVVGFSAKSPLAIKSVWAYEVNNIMIFMMVFSLLHAFLIVLAGGGWVHMVYFRKRDSKLEQVAQSQAEMVAFNEAQRNRAERRPHPPVPQRAPPQVPQGQGGVLATYTETQRMREGPPPPAPQREPPQVPENLAAIVQFTETQRRKSARASQPPAPQRAPPQVPENLAAIVRFTEAQRRKSARASQPPAPQRTPPTVPTTGLPPS